MTKAFNGRRRRLATLGGDWGAPSQLLAPGLRYVHSSGAIDSRPTLLARIEGGGVRYRHLVFDVLQVTFSQDLAVVSGEMSASVEVAGNVRLVATSYLACWAREGGAWQLVAFQGTTLADR